MMIELYASMAEAEMHKKQKRQKEGYEALKARGEWDKLGRPAAIDYKEFCKQYERVLAGKVKPFDLIKELKVSQSTYYRYKKRYDKEHAKGSDADE